jgi:prevent-host-death family protein
MDVGVRELKQRLSEYLERAAQGEHITVTERGRPKAVIAPLPGGDHLQRGIDEGWITPARHGAGLLPPAPKRSRATTTVAEMMAEDRGE